MKSALRIGIAGFGVGGGAAAVFLAREGHRVTLLERAARVGPVGAGFLLQPSGQQVLAGLGLLEPIAADSSPISGLRAFTHRGRTLIELGYGAGLQALGVHRGRVFTLLHDAALAAGAEVRLSFPVAGWREAGGEVVALAGDAAEAGPFDLLIAADGARSRLRRQVDPAVAERDDPYGALWTVGPCRAVEGYLFQVTRGSRELSGLLPLGGGRCNFFWGLRAADWEAVRQAPFAEFRNRALALNPQAGEILGGLSGFETFVFGSYRHARPRTVYRGRVLLLGDAAHATTPHLGQGANLALLDAENLTRALREENGLEAALARHARERRAQTRFYVQLSRALSPFFQSDLPVLAALRDLGLPFFPRVPLLRGAMEQTFAGLRRGWLRG